MPPVITEGTTVTCVHQGTIVPKASQQKLTVGGIAVLLSGDIKDKPVAPNCVNATNTATGTIQCSKVSSELGIVATTLKVNGTGVLLQGSNGLTNGAPPLPIMWTAPSAGQSKLQAL
jgi:hypothetical protein